MPNEQRFYRHVSTIEEAHTAIKELTDHTYDLRQQMSEMKDAHAKAMDGVHKKVQELGTALNSQINGLNVKAVPPAHGQTLKWNAATGQVEWS